VLWLVSGLAEFETAVYRFADIPSCSNDMTFKVPYSQWYLVLGLVGLVGLVGLGLPLL